MDTLLSDDVSWAGQKLGKMLLSRIRNIFSVPDTKFASATNVVRAGKRRKICVCNDVSATMSSFARALVG